MVRTVKVRLELDRDDYKRGLRDAATETRGFDAEVRSAGKDTAAMGAEVKSTGTQVEAMGREVDAAARTTRTLGDEAGKAKQKTTGLGDETKKTGDNFKTLDTRLREARDTVRQLGEEYVKSGRSADTFAKLSKAGKDVSELEKLKKAVEHLAVDAEKVGQEAGKTFTSGLQGSLSTPGLGPVLIAGLVGAAILAAPAIGAAVASGVTLGVGGGALAAGIALAAKDPRVQQSWGSLGDEVKAQLVTAGAVFAPSLVGAATTFGAMMSHDIMPSIRRDFVSLAPLVDRLAAGAAGFMTNAMPGIDRLVETAGPFIRDLSDELPNLGNAVKDFFDSVSAGGPGARQFFHDLLVLTEKTVVGVGNTIEFLSKSYAVMSGVGRLMRGDVTGAITLWDQFGDHGDGAFRRIANGSIAAVRTAVHSAGTDLQGLSAKINATALTSDALHGQMAGKILNSMMSLDQASLGFARSQTQVADSIKQNGLELDIHTAKGEANRGAILSSVQANMAQYQANLAVGMAAGDAAKAYDDNTAALERQLQKAGLTQAEIDGLIGKYRGVPAKVDTDIATKGLTEAINGLEDAIRLANGLNGRVVKLTIEEQHRTTYTSDTPPSQYFRGLAKGGIRAYARGGIDYAAASGILTASNPGTILAAEPQTGGEALIPKLGISQSRAMGLASEVGDWHGFDVVPRQALSHAQFANTRPMSGGGTTVVNLGGVHVTAGMGVDGPALARQIAGVLRPYISSMGGKVQVALGDN